MFRKPSSLISILRNKKIYKQRRISTTVGNDMNFYYFFLELSLYAWRAEKRRKGLKKKLDLQEGESRKLTVRIKNTSGMRWTLNFLNSVNHGRYNRWHFTRWVLPARPACWRTCTDHMYLQLLEFSLQPKIISGDNTTKTWYDDWTYLPKSTWWQELVVTRNC